MPDPRFKQKPLNGCSGCRRDFTSTTLFDRHRVGTYEYTLEQGLELDPPREDGRRCLDSGVALRSLRFLVQLGVFLHRAGAEAETLGAAVSPQATLAPAPQRVIDSSETAKPRIPQRTSEKRRQAQSS